MTKRYLTNIGRAGLAITVLSLSFATNSSGSGNERFHVDQFGYLPSAKKVAVISNPITGFNSADSYSFSNNATMQVVDESNNQVVFTGPVNSWNGGAQDLTAGDKGYWFDFTSVSSPGTYHIKDPTNGKISHSFDISADVYNDVLRAAVRMYYYNRCNFTIEAPYADSRWTDTPSFLGPGQDLAARNVYDQNNPATERNLSGGWYDAGDSNKYVSFASNAIHPLLSAYVQNPSVFTDDFNIPESGNGIPDLIDEIKYEIDWLKKMQNPDGSVLVKVGTTDGNGTSPKSTDVRPRYYVPACSSASIAAAGMFAHTALVFKNIPGLVSYANDLENRAELAWLDYKNNPKEENCDETIVKFGDADRTIQKQLEESVAAAVYLFALTGDVTYKNYITANYTNTEPFTSQGKGFNISHSMVGAALLYYTELSNADPVVAQDIIDEKAYDIVEDGNKNWGLYGIVENKDLYRNNIENRYYWGSNRIRCNLGSSNYDVIYYSLDNSNPQPYLDKAMSTLHYMHGVNPLGAVYMTNMYDYGAEKAMNETHHEWFRKGTIYDHALNSPNGPAPGFVVGGPNGQFSGTAAPPAGQPDQKSYLDNNDYWGNWQTVEGGIYYQAAYIKVLSKFATANGGNPNGNGGGNNGGGSNTVTIEGEDMTLDRLTSVNFSGASNGSAADIASGHSVGFASSVYNGPDATLTLNITAVDESGTGYMKLYRNNTIIETWALNNNNNQLRTFTETADFDTGDTIKIKILTSGMLDKIVYDDPNGGGSSTTKTEGENMTLDRLTPVSFSGASNGTVVDIASGETVGFASFTYTGPSGSQALTITAVDEPGTGYLKLYKNNTILETWTLDNNNNQLRSITYNTNYNNGDTIKVKILTSGMLDLIEY